MTVLPDVLRVLDETLGLQGRALHFDRATALLGGVSEFDSMTVVALITALEDHFGIALPDDELGGDVFATVGALTDFVDAQLQRAS